jgi:hypothetical protein
MRLAVRLQHRADAGATEVVGGAFWPPVSGLGRHWTTKSERFCPLPGLRSRAMMIASPPWVSLFQGARKFGLIDGLIWPKTGFASID